MQNILLLHGALECKNDLVSLAARLEQIGYKTACFSFSGHGDAPSESQFGIIQFAHELDRFIHENYDAAPLIFGYSMGGYVALYYASLNSAFNGKIMTLGTKFKWTDENIKRETKLCDLDHLQLLAPDFAASLKNKHKNVDDLLPKTKSMLERFAKEDFLNEQALLKITCSVRIGRGDNDRMVTLEETLETCRSVKNSEFYTLPKTKHPLDQVRIDLLASMIIDFEKNS